MKCQKCNRPAVVHITEIIEKKVIELHFCEDHAKEYLQHVEGEPAGEPANPLGSALVEQGKVEEAAKELAELDKKTCPVCGITFSEFRNQGRLGCPHDYIEFALELEQLMWNIHGANEHNGKRPARGPADTDERTELIRLRKEIKDAVALEEYERASEIRDRIKKIEASWKPQT